MADVVASLGFEVDTADLDKGTKGLEKMDSTAANTAATIDDLNKSLSTNTTALGNLTKALSNSSSAHQAHGRAASDSSKEIGKLAEIITYMHLRAIDQAKSIGFLGTVLTALGPVGLTVGVAIASLAAAFLFAKRAADELANKAQGLRDLSETTGFTTDRLQQLQHAGEGVGLSADRVSGFLSTFTYRVEQLRKGSGPLYDALLKIDQSLAAQATGAKTTEQAFNILRTAYQKAGDEAQKANLVRAAGTRDIAVGRLLGAPEGTGGFIISKEEVDRLSKLKNETEALKRETKEIVGFLSSDIVEGELKVARAMRDAAVAAQEAGVAWKNMPWSEWLRFQQALHAGDYEKLSPEDAALGRARIILSNRLKTSQTTATGKGDLENTKGYFMDFLRPRGPTPQESPDAESERLKRNIAVLGEAATAEELLTSRQKELNIQVKAGQVDATNAQRGYEAYRVSLSGVEEGVRQTLGIATFTDLWTQKSKELDLAVKKYNLTQEQYNTAVAVGAEQTRKAAEAQEVMRSRLPGLTQLNIDSRDLAKNLDTLGMSSINAVSSGLTDMLMGTTTLSAGFKNLSLSVVKALDEMAVKMLVVAPLVQLMKSSLSAFLPNVQLPGSNADISAGIRQQHSGGMVGAGGVFVRANPAIFLGAPRLHGGLASDEFPAILQRGERVLSKREVQQGSGNGPAVQINFTNAHPTAKVSQSSKNVGGKRIINVMVAEVGSAAARGDMDSAFGGRFGAKPRQITR